MAFPKRDQRDPPLEKRGETALAQAFSEEIERVYPRLWLISAGMAGDRSQADDLVQEAAVIAWRKFGSFERGTNFGAWMAAIVRRCAANHVRKTRNRETYAVDPTTLDALSDSDAARPSKGIGTEVTAVLGEHQTQFDDEMLKGLQSLHSDARCCFLLRALHDLSYAEIAVWMGIPEGTAMSHVHRSKQSLKRHLLACRKHADTARSSPPT